MNLTGAQLYSKATRGLRQADVISDQQFKLVFIYPMLFDSRLQGKYSPLLREFMSVSMLKEIFVSNTLHMVSLASKDHSLENENGEKSDIYSLIGKTIASRGGGYGGSLDFRMPSQSQANKFELQQKIKEKTSIIRKLLANDPRLKQLNPYVEVITLDNMIDVPVIVGTKGYDVDTLTLAFVLAASISLKKPLNTWSNVQQVFNVIENTKPEEAWTLFSNLVDNDKRSTSERLIDWIKQDHPRLGSFLQQMGSGTVGLARDAGKGIAKYIATKISRGLGIDREQLKSPGQFGKEYVKPWIPSTGRGTRDTDPMSPDFDPTLPFKSGTNFDILDVVRGNLDQAKLFFKFMLDDNLLRTQFGLDKNPGQMTTAVKKISSQGEALFFQMHQNFMELVGYNANIPIHSFFNTIYPWDSDLDYLEVKSKYLDKELSKVVGDINDEFKTLLANTFASEGVDTSRAKIMKSLCTAGLEQTTGMIEARTQELSGKRIGNIDYSAEELTGFLKVLEDATSEFSTTVEKLKNQLASVIQNSKAFFTKADNAIDDVIDNMIGAYVKQLRRDDATHAFMNIGLRRNNILTDRNDPDGRKTIKYINQGKSYLSTIITMMYYTSIVDAVCQYVKYLDVEIETVKSDVLDLPNYTLVLPIEVVVMLHSAVVSNTWRDLVSKNQVQTTNLTENYVKGIVKFISKKIDVPNLIVVDSKREEIYYKLMYTSQINKANVNTFKTFVQNVQKTALESTSNY